MQSLSVLHPLVTLLQNLVRNVASSIAESPPPTTITSLSLKKAPSHVAHVDIPCPLCLSSLSASSHIASAPVVIITDLALPALAIISASFSVVGASCHETCHADCRPPKQSWERRRVCKV